MTTNTLLLQALHAFRDNKASFLIATPQAARGLDMPAVSHVYNLDLPEDAVTYLHRAGRAGRIGSPVKGEALQINITTFTPLVFGVLMHELGAAHIALSAGLHCSARIVGTSNARVLADNAMLPSCFAMMASCRVGAPYSSCGRWEGFAITDLLRPDWR